MIKLVQTVDEELDSYFEQLNEDKTDDDADQIDAELDGEDEEYHDRQIER